MRCKRIHCGAQNIKLVFFDADSNSTLAWSRFLWNKYPDSLKPIKWSKRAIYFLLEEDLEWVADGSRLFPNARRQLRDCITEVLQEAEIQYIVISGFWKQRLQLTSQKIKNFQDSEVY